MTSKREFVGKHLRYPDLTERRRAEGGRRLKGEARQSRESAPLVSVITVCRNSAGTIEQTIRSVLNQTYDNIEYIIVDGLSDDATLDIVRRYESEIDYYVSEPDGGIYHAMNKGLELARGDYILLLNSDDWHAPGCVEALVAAKDYSGCDFVSALASYVDEEAGKTTVLRSMPFDSSQLLRMTLRHETMLVPAAIYDRVGPYDATYGIIADLEFTRRLFKAGLTHYEVPRPLLHFRTNGVSNTNPEQLKEERNRFVAAEFPFLGAAECAQLGDSWKAGPEAIVGVANAHLDQTPLVKACRALLADRKRNGSGKWAAVDLSAIGKGRPDVCPKVSVIVPFYNAEKTIRASLQSVLDQSLEEFEVLCINDCAIDDSQAIVDQFAVGDPRIKRLKNSSNIGLGASRNAGVRAARGRYIFHLDPDDTLPPRALETLHQAAVKYGSVMIKGGYLAQQSVHGKVAKEVFEYPLGMKEGVTAQTSLAKAPELLAATEGHWSFLYDAVFAEQVAYPVNLKMGQDSIFLVNALSRAASVTLIPEIVYNYTPNPDSAMNRFTERKFFDAIEWRRRAWHVLRDAGQPHVGENLLFNYWDETFFSALEQKLSPNGRERFFAELRNVFEASGFPGAVSAKNRNLREIFDRITGGSSKIAGRVERYPDLTGVRQAEGGRRLTGESRQSGEGAPLVSIVTVCRNSEKTIEQTIRSVLDQTYENVEYIVVDGQSSDATLDVLRRYETEIDYYVSEPDGGIYHAMNKGLALAKGKYILVLNSDDWYAPDCVEALVAAKNYSGCDIVSGMAQYVDQQGTPLKLALNLPLDAGVYLLMPLRHETMLVAADIYDAAGPYDTDLVINADRHFTTELFKGGYTHYCVPKVLLFFRNTGVSSVNMERLTTERRKMLKRYFPGVSRQDIESLADLEKLTPALLMEIISRYSNPAFRKSLIAYGKARKARGNRLWKDSDFSGVDSSGETSALAAGRPLLSVATFSTQDHGGAGIGSQRRVAALRKHNVDATIHCIFKETDEAHVKTIPLSADKDCGASSDEARLRKAWRLHNVVTRKTHPNLRAREFFSKPGSLVDFNDLRDVFETNDIVHLHWVVGMFDYDNAAALLKDKPVAWTLADMNAFTGGCHYSEGCDGYKNECRECPLLPGSGLAHETWLTKRKAYAGLKNLHIICPSQWLADRAAESSLLGGRPIHVIPNAFPVEKFQPTNKFAARQQLGLPLDKKLVLFGAQNVANARKGGDILAECFKNLAEKDALQDVHGVFFGANALDIGVKSHNLGRIADEVQLSLVYAAADVFAFPSREDNAPLTVAESLLSGTPAVSFPVGNVPEFVTHLKTGYIARYLDVEDFSDGIMWALSSPHGPEAINRGIRCHLAARAYNDPETAVARHLDLYKTMMEQ